MKFIALVMKVIHILIDYVSLLSKELKSCYIVLITKTKIKINVNTEVSFRISLYIANFLGENEAQAQQIFKQVRKMYSSRSSAVHGNKTKDNHESAVVESASFLNRILRRCAELNRLPDVDDLVFRTNK